MKKIIFTNLPLVLALNPFCVCLSSCSCQSKKGEEYAEQYCKEWYQNLTKDPDDLWYTHGVDHHINPLYEASAVNLFTYSLGWTEWNSLLHTNKGEIPENMWDNYVENEGILPSYKDPKFNFNKGVSYQMSFKLGDYKVLENALNRCKCGPITTYHGMENQEIELLNQINSIWGLQDDYNIWKSIENKSVLREQDLSKLIDQTLDYDGFCATSINRETAVEFLIKDFCQGFENVIFYEIEVDENTNGAYVSSRNYLFNNIPLAWPNEEQLLLSSKLKLKVTDAYWSDPLSSNKNVLVIKCKGFHNTNI
ncbi:MAG: hypothetical protein IJK72_01965 [Mycoplasma sp.]|nr:hypothetical protein [Mycoplasma sp.]